MQHEHRLYTKLQKQTGEDKKNIYIIFVILFSKEEQNQNTNETDEQQ